jgi:ADP-dependent NAD(P)H-hydrate dehydratase / NAD(P)H-hydrate epimerase
VLDADALSALADDLTPLARARAPRVLTPHPGEAARLLHTDTARIAADRYAAALELARRAGHVVVLKGAGTVVAGPDGRLAVCTRGTPALGAGGTGDVLAGACTALLAALAPFDAAVAAVELHARAGELCASGGLDRGVLASEVAAALPRALEACRA